MNQNARKLAKTKVEKDFYKLLNKSNFGNDCRNNIGNCKLELMFVGLEEIAYIKKYTNIMLDNTYREFFSLDLLCQQVQKEFKKKKEKLDKSNPFYDGILEILREKELKILRRLNAMKKSKKKRESLQCLPLIQSKIRSKVVKI